MARAFSGSSQYLRYSGAVVTGYPFTMAAWGYATGTSNRTLMSISNSGASTSFRIRIRMSLGDADFISEVAGAAAQAFSPVGIVNNTWQHFCAVATSSTSRVLYGDGQAGTPNTTSSTPTGLNRTSIGVKDTSTQTEFFVGRAAEAAVWDVALTAAEAAMLAAGVCPLLVRPANLVAYWPLYGNGSPEPDLVGRFALTVTGATKVDQPRIFMPRREKVFLPATTAPAPKGMAYPRRPRRVQSLLRM